jgi:hypothetical protein
MSRADFARASNNACARAHRAEKRIPNPTNYATLLHGLQRAIPVVEHEIIALRGLTPARSDAALFARALKDLDAQDLVAHRLVDALEAQQISRNQGPRSTTRPSRAAASPARRQTWASRVHQGRLLASA